MRWWPWRKRQRPMDEQLDAELRFHLGEIEREKIAAGLTAVEAHRQAVLELGGQEQLKEELRDVYRLATFENTVSNLKSGFRVLRKSPSVSIAVIATLALGIGANSAVFSAINAILLRPLPFPDADELVMLRQADRKAQNPWSFVAPLRLLDWDRSNTTFQVISGWYTSDISETSGDLPEKITEALVAPRFLQLWGISPAIGRDFAPEEQRFGGPLAALISHRLWQRRFHSDAGVIGKRLRIESSGYTIIGVMPASFLFPDHSVDIWIPNPMDAPYAQDRASTWFNVVGRLKPGVTIAKARADLAHVQSNLGRQFPKTDADLTVGVQPLKEDIVSGTRRSLWVLFGSVSLLLLIACSNVAALLLARTAGREREIAVRFSLGASRASIVAQLMTECFVLAGIGSAAGLFIAYAGASVLRTFAKSLPRVEEITLDWRIVAYTLTCGIAAIFVCGLFPAIRGTRRSIAGKLAHASRSQVSTKNPLQWLLIGIQVAFAVTLLCGAGLLLRSFEELGRVSPGFETAHILTLRISANWGETAAMDKLTAHINQTLDTLRATPGVLAAATAGELPGVPGDNRTELKMSEGRAESEGKILAQSRFVSNGYFETMKIPVLQGEGCRATANYFSSIVVNRSFANTYFRESSAIGHHLEMATSQFLPTPVTISGIVADAREQGLNHEPVPTVYWCVSAPYPTPYFLIRAKGDPLSVAQAVRHSVHRVAPSRSVYDLESLDQQLSASYSENRLRTILLALFAVSAVSLVCVGLYGTLSYFVALRRREIALRLALGAVRGQVTGHFLWRGMAVTAVGCAGGLILAAASATGLSGMLYQVSPLDVRTYLAVSVLMLSVAGMASLLPALRASRVEPMDVLREE